MGRVIAWKKLEQRAQLVVEDQRVALGAASGGEQHRGVDQGVEVDQVEQVLEQARIGATVDRRGDQQQVGAFDLVEHRLQFRRRLVARQGSAQRRGDVGQLDDPAVDRQRLAKLGDQGLGEYQGAGRAIGAAGDGDDFEGAGHGISCGLLRQVQCPGARAVPTGKCAFSGQLRRVSGLGLSATQQRCCPTVARATVQFSL